uniref:Secreted protein n=1 Tax=Ascaris lumbricoides TaxID=6252 RepID=A0A0M3IC25_ASCLU
MLLRFAMSICDSIVFVWRFSETNDMRTLQVPTLLSRRIVYRTVRTIIISLCTIIPLAPYRKAATQLICRKRNTQTSQSMEVTMAVNCLNSRRRCTFIAPSGEAFGIDATLTQVEAYPYAR